jgi:diguanylate cyclase (GGDEF)-like protein
MNSKQSIVAGLAAAALSLCAAAAEMPDPSPIDLFDLGAPAFTNFSVRDGVPDSVTVSVQAARDGFVGLASAQGLARYDGRHWDAGDARSISGAVGYLMVDHDGTLWAAFHDRGVAQFDGHDWHFDDPGKAPASPHIRRLAETIDAQGRYELWAATFDAGLFLRDGDRWVPAPGNEQLPRGVLSVARTHTLGGHERLWAGTFNEGVWYREDGNWQRLRAPPFDPAQVEHLLVSERDGREALWISAFGNGVWRLDESGFHSWSVAQGNLPTDEVYDFARSRSPAGTDVVWLASRSGLVRFRGDHADVFDRRHGLPSNAVRGVSVWRSPDGVDVIWLATEAGVARAVIGASQWQTASLMGAQSIGVFGVLVEADGSGGERLWVASSGDGLGLYEHGHWRQFSQANGALPDSDVRMVRRAIDDDGQSTLWIGQRNGYLLRARDGPKFESIDVPWEHHPGQAVMDIIGRTVGGHIERWVATRQSGIYRWRDGAWTAFRADEAVGQWRITSLLEQVDAAGRSWLWATTNQGLARFDTQRWTLIGLRAGLPDLQLSGISLIPDADGRPVLWLGSLNSSIIRVDIADPANPRVLPANLPPPPDVAAYGARRDSAGRIYVCTNSGVQLLTPSRDGYVSEVFKRRDGMVHEECNTNAQFVDAHDRFWTGTLGGLAVFDPSRAITDRQPKPLALTDVRIDGSAASEREAIHVPDGRHSVHIEFALLAWQHETESRFRTQLLGFDAQPGTWTDRHYRDFNALPPGDYTLRIEGRDYAGNVSGPLDVALSIVPSWWQHASARMALALLAALALYGLLLWRTRSIEIQRRALAQQIDERTAELNAANARLLQLSYTDSLTGLSNRRALLDALEARVAAGTRATIVFADVDHFKDYNDHFGHPAGDEALCSVAKAMQAAAPEGSLLSRYGGEEFALLLDSDLAGAVAVAERIRAAVEVADVPIPGTAVVNHVTISAGVASRLLATMDDAHHLLREADNALYHAKSDGRNCVRS